MKFGIKLAKSFISLQERSQKNYRARRIAVTYGQDKRHLIPGICRPGATKAGLYILAG